MKALQDFAIGGHDWINVLQQAEANGFKPRIPGTPSWEVPVTVEILEMAYPGWAAENLYD